MNADTRPTFVALGLVCAHCKAFNGRSRCGCAKARAERGEKPAAVPSVADMDAIELVF